MESPVQENLIPLTAIVNNFPFSFFFSFEIIGFTRLFKKDKPQFSHSAYQLELKRNPTFLEHCKDIISC